MDYLLTFILHLSTSILATIATVRIWPKKMNVRLVAGLLIMLNFFNPYSVTWGFFLPGDNSRLALFFFFASVIFIQQWFAKNYKKIYLFVGLGLFLMSLLTYENSAFLFPAALFFGWPLRQSDNIKQNKKMLIGAATAGISLPLFLLLFYNVLASLQSTKIFHTNPLIREDTWGTLSSRLILIPSSFLDWVSRPGHPLRKFDLNTSIATQIIFFSVLVIAMISIARNLYMKKYSSKSFDDRKNILFIYLAGIWILIFGLLTYQVAFGGTNQFYVRVFSSAAYGIPILLVLGFSFSSKRYFQIILALACLMAVSVGITQFFVMSDSQSNRRQVEMPNQYVNLANSVQAVKADTSFIFIDFTFGYEGFCGPALRMLYNTKGLRCIYVSSTDEELSATALNGLINFQKGGKVSTGSYLLFEMLDNGNISLVDKISPDSNLLISWEDETLLDSNEDLILPFEEAQKSKMLEHLIAWQLEN